MTLQTETTLVSQVPAAPASGPAIRRKGPGDGSISRPIMNRSVEIATIGAQKVYRRTFDTLSRNCYYITVVTRIILDDETAEKADELMNQYLSDTKKMISDEIERGLAAVADASLVGCEPNYSKPQAIEVKITTPESAKYLGLIKQLDELTRILDTLWLNGEIDKKHHSLQLYHWQRHVLRTAGRIRALADQLRATKKNRDQVGEEDESLEDGHLDRMHDEAEMSTA